MPTLLGLAFLLCPMRMISISGTGHTNIGNRWTVLGIADVFMKESMRLLEALSKTIAFANIFLVATDSL